MTQKEYIALVNEAKQRSYEYYVLSDPTISDAEFDALVDRIEQAEQEHPEWTLADSPTQCVGSDDGQAIGSPSHTDAVMPEGTDAGGRGEVDDHDIEAAEGAAPDLRPGVEDGRRVVLAGLSGRRIDQRGLSRSEGRDGSGLAAARRSHPVGAQSHQHGWPCRGARRDSLPKGRHAGL